MTFARKEEILSKDILTIQDVMELNGMTYQPAAKLIRDIKRMMSSRYQVTGKIATSDYVKFFDGDIPQQVEPVIERREPLIKERRSMKREIPLLRVKDYIAK